MFGKDDEFGGVFDEEYEKSEEEKNYEKFLETFHTLPITEFTTNFLFDPEFGVFRGKSARIAHWILSSKVLVTIAMIGIVYLILLLEFKLAVFVYKFCTKTIYWFVFLLFWLPCFILRRLLRGHVNVDLEFFRGLGKENAVFRHFENISKHRKSILFWFAVFYVMFSRFSVFGIFL